MLLLYLMVLFVTMEWVVGNVIWKLDTKVIRLGQPMSLVCIVDDITAIDTKVTRQWSIRHDDDVISYNGHSNNPSKYVETLTHGNSFKLNINNVTESDLNIIYQCTYEFKTYPKLLEVTADNFERLPQPGTCNVTTEYSTDNFTISVYFTDIFPLPKCSAYRKDMVFEFQILTYSRKRILYDVFMINQSNSNPECGTTINIECSFGKSVQKIKNVTLETCNEPSKGISTAVASCISAALFIVLLFIGIIKYMYQRRQDSGKNENANEPGNKEMSLMLQNGEFRTH